jgi:thymidylate synthase (FAD)
LSVVTALNVIVRSNLAKSLTFQNSPNMEVHSASFRSCSPDAESAIVQMARVSSPSNQNNVETGPRLIQYLIDHKHWSPFQMASMQLEIKTTRAIAPQLLRHRSFAFQEFSFRYANVAALPTISLPLLRVQCGRNAQSSDDEKFLENEAELLALIEKSQDIALHAYDSLIAAGVARECARSILPMGIPTRLYMSGTLRSWIHYINLRTEPNTQLEHRMIALDAKRIFCEHFPQIAIALQWIN